jgi:hypothetical protein
VKANCGGVSAWCFFFFAYLGCFFLQFLSLGDGRIWL